MAVKVLTSSLSSVRPSVSSCDNWATTGRIFIKFGFEYFFLNILGGKKLKVH